MTAEVPFRTLSKIFSETAAKFGPQVAIRDAVPKAGAQSHTFSEQFEQISYTWNQYKQEACSFAKALISYGVQPGRVVAIQGSNSAKWLFANIGTIIAGGISAGVYHANDVALSHYCMNKVDPQVIVVEDETQLYKYSGFQSQSLKCFVVWNKAQNDISKIKLLRPVFSWDEFVLKGKQIKNHKLDARIESQNPDDVCSLIFTSGSTGLPKACALSHKNLSWTAEAAGKAFHLDSSHRGISYLPLSNIAARQLECIGPLTFGYQVDIAPKDAAKYQQILLLQMTHTRPSYFLAIPRVWEKFRQWILEKLKSAPMYQRVVFYISTACSRWAFHNFEQICRKNSASLSVVDRVTVKVCKFVLKFFETVTLHKIKHSIGLDQCKIAASGASEIDREVVEFFAGLNIRILNMYGMSETSGLIALSRGLNTPRGSCGKPLEGSHVNISRVHDEICVKGPNVMKEYYNERNETKKAFDENNFFRTGDAGHQDQHGNLFIAGRIQEVIKTSDGKIIAPRPIEQEILDALPFIAHAVVVGNKRPSLACLLTLARNPNSPKLLAKEVLDLLKKLGSKAMTPKEAIRDELFCKYVKESIEKTNAKAGPNVHQVHKFTLLEDYFSIENGLLTPPQKPKRSIIEERYKEAIQQMYEPTN